LSLKIPLDFKGVDTLPHETLLSENWQQSVFLTNTRDFSFLLFCGHFEPLLAKQFLTRSA